MMTQKKITKLIFLVVFSATMYSAAAQKKFTVTTAEEFAAAIKPDCEIIIGVPQIIISDLKPANEKYYDVVEDSAGRSHITIKNVSDLKISGVSYNSSYIVSSNEQQAVLYFEKCTNITLKNITFAHGPDRGKDCNGAALLFAQCESVLIDSCYLFGSGSFGIKTVKFPDLNFGIKKLTCSNSIIGSCTVGIMHIAEASDVLFNNCQFIDNKGGAYFENSNYVIFDKCTFSLNSFIPDEPSTKEGLHISYLIDIEKTENLSFSSCTFLNNSFGYLVHDPSLTAGLLGSTFSNNNFLNGVSFKE